MKLNAVPVRISDNSCQLISNNKQTFAKSKHILVHSHVDKCINTFPLWKFLNRKKITMYLRLTIDSHVINYN